MYVYNFCTLLPKFVQSTNVLSSTASVARELVFRAITPAPQTDHTLASITGY